PADRPVPCLLVRCNASGTIIESWRRSWISCSGRSWQGSVSLLADILPPLSLMNDILHNHNRLFSSEVIDNETELIPLITAEDEELMNAESTPAELPILPLRNTVLFPGVVIPITVGRDRSIRLIQDVYRGNRTLGVVSQKDGQIEEPRAEDLNKIGTIATIIRMLRMPDGSTTAIIQGKKRFELIEMVKSEPYFTASIKEFSELRPAKDDKNFDALVSSLKDLA